MENIENRNLWQCANLFRPVCPNYEDPAMKLVVALFQEMINDMTVEAVQAAEGLCKSCPVFSRKERYPEQ